MKKIKITLLFLLLLASATINDACKKDFKAPETVAAPENCLDCLEERKHLFIRSSNATNDRDGDETEIGNRKMVLGAKRANPFSVAAMTQAWNTLWPQIPITSLSPTHLYVRFKPASLEEYKLLEPFNIPLKTFPLDYEITTDGDWYDDPSVPNDQIPWFYSVVKPDFQFPAMQYEILEQLFLAPMKSVLTRRSFSIIEHTTGVTYRDECVPECQNWPECEDYPAIGCGDIYVPPPTGGGGGTGIVYPPSETSPPCDPNDPEDIDEYCFEEEDVPYTPQLNSCGCSAYGTRNPAGCVKVVDTQLPSNSAMGVHLAGVNEVEIEWWNGWFGFWSTHTDANGCWRIPHADYGVGYMLVKFKNDRATIRGLRGLNIWEYAFATQDWVGQMGGPTFNDITVVYTPTGSDASASKIFWYAATCNNALAEYYSYAAADGIAAPPNHLDVLLFNQGGSASTPMFGKTGFLGQILFLGEGWILTALLSVPLVGGVLAAAYHPLAIFMSIWAPDMVYLYGTDGTEMMVSDFVKETFYHEFGHAAHFNELNNISYWDANVLYVINNAINSNNSPYGTASTPGAGRCAVIEMWGYHIGPQYADRKYGLFHSNTSPPDELGRWNNFWLEPNLQGAIFPSDAWIPFGLLYDLSDGPTPPGVTENATGEAVTGFTNSQFFSAISNGDPTSVAQVKSAVTGGSLPPGQTVASVNALFAVYGH